jgi:hypothetical protein
LERLIPQAPHTAIIDALPQTNRMKCSSPAHPTDLRSNRWRPFNLPKPAWEASMEYKAMLTQTSLRTPRAAAIAGILFCGLFISAFWMLYISVPADPLEPGEWLRTYSNTVAIALHLVPFAGIAFLWFIGVLRDRLGEREDRFFATVFFGSGLLFLAMLFAAAAIVGAIIMAFAAEPNVLINSSTFRFARTLVYNIVNIYATKMAGVFMISTSTVAIYTGFAPRSMAFIGYGLALLLLFGGYYPGWIFIVFPLWVFLFSIYILVENFRRPQIPAESSK